MSGKAEAMRQGPQPDAPATRRPTCPPARDPARHPAARCAARCLAALHPVVLLVLLALAPGAARADGEYPLRPPDTSSPRATLYGFIATTDRVYSVMTKVLQEYNLSGRLFPDAKERREQADAIRNVPDALRFLDLSGIPPVLRDTLAIARLIQLKEILDRIDIPPEADVPDRAAMAQGTLKKWRLPNTEIDIVLVEKGPQAGQYVFSAETVDRLPAFYQRVRDLPYKPGPAQELAATYRAISHGGSATIYDAILNSPVGLSYIVPPRWMLNLPGWAKLRIVGTAAWQWFGLAVGIAIAWLIVSAGQRLARRRARQDQDDGAVGWRALLEPLAVLFVAAVLLPRVDAVLRIGGNVRIVVEYGLTGLAVLSAAWLSVVASGLAGEALVSSEHLTARSLDSQLIRLGMRLVGLVVAAAILIWGGDELGFPAYSILAGLGVGGLAVALAAQSTIANLIGSLLIVLERPFRVGHFVRIGGSEGMVEDVGFRSTRMRTLDNSQVSIPSSSVVSSTIENLSLRPKRRQRLLVQVTYDTPAATIDALVAGIRRLIAEHPAAESGTCMVHLNNFGESSLDILVIFHLLVADYAAELREREAVMLKIMRLVTELGADFAFPTRTLHLAGPEGAAGERRPV
jgi:MscS family membrane protein